MNRRYALKKLGLGTAASLWLPSHYLKGAEASGIEYANKITRVPAVAAAEEESGPAGLQIGCVAHWDFESGALETDSGPNGYDLTNYNTVVSTSGGKPDNCADFDGTNYFRTAHTGELVNLFSGTGMAVSLWLKCDLGTFNWSIWGGAFKANGWDIRAINDGMAFATHYSGARNNAQNNVVGQSDGLWRHVLGIWTPTEQVLIVNNTYMANDVTLTQPVEPATSDLLINDTAKLTGLMDSVSIWNVALSFGTYSFGNPVDADTDAEALYNSGNGLDWDGLATVT